MIKEEIELIKHIYMDENWAGLQAMKEEGCAGKFEFSNTQMSITYPFIKRKAGVVNGVTYSDLVTPRGEMGPYLEKKDAQSVDPSFLKEYQKVFLDFCRKNNIVAEYIRFDSWNKREKYFASLYQLSSYGDIYSNNLNYDFFQEEYSSSKRRNVKKAIKEGVEVEFKSDRQAVEQFLKLYHYTQAKYDASAYHQIDHIFINQYFHHLKDKVFFAQAIYQQQVISSVLLLEAEDILHYHLAAHDPNFLNLNANALILYESAKKAQSLNKKIFDLGSAQKGSSLEKYKSGLSKPYPSALGTFPF